ncbi:MAG: hypothetical protein V3S87_02865, partial [Alphaproteobacteria bacterium]
MVVGLVGVVAVAGWGLALNSMGNTGGLEQELRAAKADLSVANVELVKMSSELAATREVQQGLQDANAS